MANTTWQLYNHYLIEFISPGLQPNTKHHRHIVSMLKRSHIFLFEFWSLENKPLNGISPSKPITLRDVININFYFYQQEYENGPYFTTSISLFHKYLGNCTLTRFFKHWKPYPEGPHMTYPVNIKCHPPPDFFLSRLTFGKRIAILLKNWMVGQLLVNALLVRGALSTTNTC